MYCPGHVGARENESVNSMITNVCTTGILNKGGTKILLAKIDALKRCETKIENTDLSQKLTWEIN